MPRVGIFLGVHSAQSSLKNNDEPFCNSSTTQSLWPQHLPVTSRNLFRALFTIQPAKAMPPDRASWTSHTTRDRCPLLENDFAKQYSNSQALIRMRRGYKVPKTAFNGLLSNSFLFKKETPKPSAPYDHCRSRTPKTSGRSITGRASRNKIDQERHDTAQEVEAYVERQRDDA